jgi:hypothetical protein
MTEKTNPVPKIAIQAVVQVGIDGNGRGFIVAAGDDRHVITAAHCLPRKTWPDPHLANSVRELTFLKFIGPLGAKHGTIWSELCVLNLTDDIAVFGEPDWQFDKEGKRYEKFTTTALSVGASPPIVPPYQWDKVPGSKGFVLSLDRKWLPCTIHNTGRFLTLDGVKIEGGMSGSPILNADGAAIGVISTGNEGRGNNTHPSLADCLPPWLWRRISALRLEIKQADVKPQIVHLTVTPAAATFQGKATEGDPDE